MALTINGSGGGIPTGTLKVETGSYTGTGTVGSSNPNSITFSGTPVYVVVSNTSSTDDPRHIVFHPLALASSYAVRGWAQESASSSAPIPNYAFSKLDGKTLSWYQNVSSSSGATAQMNKSGVTYKWSAITY